MPAVLARGDRQGVPSQTTPVAPPDSLAYAESLYRYAGSRLDPYSLRCWIIRRLMLDDGLDHSCAELAFEHVLASKPEREEVRAARAGRTSSRGRVRGRLRSRRPAGRVRA